MFGTLGKLLASLAGILPLLGWTGTTEELVDLIFTTAGSAMQAVDPTLPEGRQILAVGGAVLTGLAPESTKLGGLSTKEQGDLGNAVSSLGALLSDFGSAPPPPAAPGA